MIKLKKGDLVRHGGTATGGVGLVLKTYDRSDSSIYVSNVAKVYWFVGGEIIEHYPRYLTLLKEKK